MLPHVYSLHIFVDYINEIAKSLSQSIKHLINLHEFFIFNSSYEPPKDVIQDILSEIYALPNIEILKHNLISIKNLNDPPKLASLDDYSKTYNRDEVLDKTTNFIKDRSNLLTEVFLRKNIYSQDGNIESEKNIFLY